MYDASLGYYDFQNVSDIQLLILNTAGRCLYMYIKIYTYVETLKQTNFLIWFGCEAKDILVVRCTGIWANDT